MKIICTRDEAAFDSTMSEILINQITSKKDGVIGLSTGRTTGNFHRITASKYVNEGFNVGNTTFFGIDEVTGIDRKNPWACYTKLRNEMLDALGVDDDHFLMFPTTSDDFAAECTRFTSELEKRGGADLIILGLGENGHLGFNQPGSDFEGGAGLSTMDDDLQRRIKEDCGLPESSVLGGVTIGLKDIMKARKLILAVKGSSKAAILKKVMYGPVTEEVPASILQTHPDCTVVMDKAAAGE